MKKFLDQHRHDIRDCEAVHLIAELIGEAQLILKVGASSGHDFSLSKWWKQVINMDTALQRHLPAMIQADGGCWFPLPLQSSGVVIKVAEALEHSVKDWLALPTRMDTLSKVCTFDTQDHCSSQARQGLVSSNCTYGYTVGKTTMVSIPHKRNVYFNP